jgi:deoxyribose-phosphate aldolase
MDLQYLDVAKSIDHALLRPNTTDQEIEAGCELARRLGVASVCVIPHALPRVIQLLAGSGVLPTTTIGFPHGGHTTRGKKAEAAEAVAAGALELDMVVNVGKVLSGDLAYVRHEIDEVLGVARRGGARLKVIFENCYLERAHKLSLCAICSDLGVDWVKTSTGFGPSGATTDDIRLMRENTAPIVQVKASGGIRTLAQVRELKALGASRIGTSSSEAILAEARSLLG